MYQYKALLSGRVPVSAEDLMARLEISRATLKRDIAKLRDQLHVPVKFDRNRGGYIIEEGGPGHTDSELPGLWFSPDEVLALVTIQHLLTQLAPGVLGPKLKAFQGRLSELMAKNGLSDADAAQRIRLVHAGQRRLKPQHFEAVAAATLARKRLQIRHFKRESGETIDREVSPIRLVHYRDNWYLDAWCHLRDGLRSFAIDAVATVDVLDAAAVEIPEEKLDAEVGEGYGIFGGRAHTRAVLKFTPERARWVRREIWHPKQEASELPDGSYVLSVPYSDHRELLGDVLRFGDGVEVVAPSDLRQKVQKALIAAVAAYVH